MGVVAAWVAGAELQWDCSHPSFSSLCDARKQRILKNPSNTPFPLPLPSPCLQISVLYLGWRTTGRSSSRPWANCGAGAAEKVNALKGRLCGQSPESNWHMF